jgi:histidyl-tRNA synthetase
VPELLQAIRGMNDILPNKSYVWKYLENLFVNCLTSYGYNEIRLPVIEQTQLFKRTIGEITDIVEKEMYTFSDLNGDSLTLRPEGTAGCVRACLEHGLLHNQAQKLWYYGPMFRHEKPQRGRYRQFHHFGVEALGIDGYGIECELLLICHRLWQNLGILDSLTLTLNTLGEIAERNIYRDALVAYFKQHENLLDEDSKRRLDRNPLRILDSKNPDLKELISNAPILMDFLSLESKQRFQSLCASLDSFGIKYTIDTRLVRGLDYYGHTVFEWVTDCLGSQATVCAGGRYDGLVAQLGGNSTPAVGFAMGVERLEILLETLNKLPEPNFAHIYIIAVGDATMLTALKIAEQIRTQHALTVIVNTSGGSFKSQFKKADKSGADLALILGEDEINNHTIGIKLLRQQAEQKNILQSELDEYIRGRKCQYT